MTCPCLFSPSAPATSRPTEGDCHVAFLFHINQGAYGDAKLDGLNSVACWSSNGPIANGKLTTAVYVDERADEKQAEALSAIFGGTAGGPMGAFAPLFGKSLGVKKAPIAFKIDGKVRSGEIPGVLSMSVRPLQSLVEGEEIWVSMGYSYQSDKACARRGPRPTRIMACTGTTPDATDFIQRSTGQASGANQTEEAAVPKDVQVNHDLELAAFNGRNRRCCARSLLL